MWLLIDDIRDLGCDVTARTAEEGRAALQEYWGEIDSLCLDHDLGERESGYDVACWALERGLMPCHVQIVSMNPVGRKNIATALEMNGYHSSDGVNFYKQ